MAGIQQQLCQLGPKTDQVEGEDLSHHLIQTKKKYTLGHFLDDPEMILFASHLVPISCLHVEHGFSPEITD